jgi:hypothetical protein
MRSVGPPGNFAAAFIPLFMNVRYLLRRGLLPALLPVLAALPFSALAQRGVGIGTTAPDVSAALDIVSSGKGALLPRVASAAGIASPATGLIVFQTGSPAGFYYNAGTATAPSWQQLATVAGAALTAGSGLTKTGQDLTLGGTLTQNTTLDQGSNTLSLTGAGNLGVGTASPSARLDVVGSLRVGQASQLNQLTADGSIGGQASIGQSFTLPAGAAITQINVYSASNTATAATLKLYQGAGFGGTELASQAVTLQPGGSSGLQATPLVLTTPVAVAAGTYTFAIQSAAGLAINGTNPYPGGILYGSGMGPRATSDLKFAVYYSLGSGPASTLYIDGGRVGVGTDAPTATLDVDGSARLRGLSTPGVVTTDAQGNLSSASATTAFGTSFIQNTTTPQAGASFNVGGSGTVGGGLSVSGATTINTTGGNTSIGGLGSTVTIGNGSFVRIGSGGSTSIGSPGNTTTIGNGGLVRIGGGGGATIIEGVSTIGEDNAATTFIGTGVSSGPVNIGRSGGAVQVRNLTTAGVVTTDANGTLGSSSATVAFGSSFIQNQTSTDQAAGFRLSGSGALGGNLGVGTSTPSTRLDLGPGYGSSATDAATKKLAVYNSPAGTDFYGLGVSGGYLHLFAGAAATAAPALSISNGGSVGVGTGTSAPRGRLDVAGPGDSYLVADPSNGGNQNLYLPGSLFLAPHNGTSGPAYVQARVPNPGSSTNIGLTLRTTNSGNLVDALVLKENGKVVMPVLGGGNNRVVTVDNNGTLDASNAASLDATTAGNGLSETGTQVRLGGTLTQATTITQAGNSLSLTGGATGQSAGQEAYTPGNNGGYYSGAAPGQSFTLPTAATVTAITVINNASVNGTGTVTLRLFAGNGSTPTYSQTVQAASGLSRYVLTTPQLLPAGTSRFEFVNGSGMNTVYMLTTFNSYTGGDLYNNGVVYYFQTGENPEGHRDAYFVVDYLVSSTVPTLYAAPSGCVGIGTSSPAHPLTIVADGSANSGLLGLYDNFGTDKFNFSLSGGGFNLSESNVAGGRLFVQSTSGNVGIGTTNPAYKLDVNGLIRGANVSPSDRRLKQDIRPLGATLAQLLQLHGARYRWNALGVARGGEAGRAQIGLIAQEVEALYPELVSTDAEGYKAVNYAQLAPVLLEAIRELKADNDALRADAATDRAARQLQLQQAAADHADLQTLKEQLARLLGEAAPAPAQARR